MDFLTSLVAISFSRRTTGYKASEKEKERKRVREHGVGE
jgi:hypothetical protein